MLFALGGGVVGDMTGFAAASYMRGVPFVQVPTTLLAQVDSSVGGKTAINHPLGKNMIGAFYQPQLVVCDLATLQTLPPRELSAGLAEVIKYGPIYDMAFFDWIEANIEALRRARPGRAGACRQAQLRDQGRVVGQDERETGLRAILNFGHTFGHAIESGSATANGCTARPSAAAWSWRRTCRSGSAASMRPSSSGSTRLIERAGLPIGRARRCGAERYLELMRVDKKSEAGEIRFVVIDKPGSAVVRSAPDAHGARGARRSAARVNEPAAMSARALRQPSGALARPSPCRAARAHARRLPARPRPHRAFHRLSPAGLQDAGVPQPRGRPVPHPAHAFAGGRAARALHRAGAAAERRPGRGHRPGARPRATRPSATRGRTRSTTACAAHGGFEHNLQSLRVVDALEHRYPQYDGLNLSFETREGILKHCSRANAERIEAAEPDGVGHRFLDRTQPSLEAQLCNLADEIAYNAHDIDDGVRSGLIGIEQLAEVELFERYRREALAEHPAAAPAAACCTKPSAAC